MLPLLRPCRHCCSLRGRGKGAAILEDVWALLLQVWRGCGRRGERLVLCWRLCLGLRQAREGRPSQSSHWPLTDTVLQMRASARVCALPIGTATGVRLCCNSPRHPSLAATTTRGQVSLPTAAPCDRAEEAWPARGQMLPWEQPRLDRRRRGHRCHGRHGLWRPIELPLPPKTSWQDSLHQPPRRGVACWSSPQRGPACGHSDALLSSP